MITAHNLDRFREAERESSTAISELLTSTQPAPGVGTAAPQTTKRESGSKTTAPTEIQTTKITWAYDAELSKQIAELIIEEHPGWNYNQNMFKELGPGNFVHDNVIANQNQKGGFIGKVYGDTVAHEIINAWSNLSPKR